MRLRKTTSLVRGYTVSMILGKWGDSLEQKPKADLALAFYSLIWGVTFVVVKNALDESSVFLFRHVGSGIGCGRNCAGGIAGSADGAGSA